MPYAKFPQSQRRQQKPAGKQRQKNEYLLRPAAQHIQKGIILHQRIGNDESRKKQHPAAIDTDGIFPVFPCAIRKYIHEFQPVQRKETQCGINNE